VKHSLLTLCLIVWASVEAHGQAGTQSAPVAAPDPRIPIVLAQARRENWRCLMRGHLKALIEAMQHMSAGEYALAAMVTEDNYGLAPGKPEYCREPLFTKDASITAAGLPPPPPEAVRGMFSGMQQQQPYLSTRHATLNAVATPLRRGNPWRLWGPTALPATQRTDWNDFTRIS
jgi:hypothetical protein